MILVPTPSLFALASKVVKYESCEQTPVRLPQKIDCAHGCLVAVTSQPLLTHQVVSDQINRNCCPSMAGSPKGSVSSIGIAAIFSVMSHKIK